MRENEEKSIRKFEIETLISYLKFSYLIFLVYTNYKNLLKTIVFNTLLGDAKKKPKESMTASFSALEV